MAISPRGGLGSGFGLGGAATPGRASSSSPTRSIAPAAFCTSPQVSPSAPTEPAAITARKANWKSAPQLSSFDSAA